MHPEMPNAMLFQPRSLLPLAALLPLLAPAAASAAELPTLTLLDADASESARDLAIVARLSAPARWPVLASIRIAGGEARNGVDYLAPAPQLVMLPGETEARIVLTLRDDRDFEGDETAIVALGRVEGATVARGRAIALIRDDDRLPEGFAVASFGGAATAPPPAAAPATEARLAAGPLSTRQGRILDAAGAPARLSGVNWFGLETPNAAPHGIWTRGWRDMMAQMKDLGFNLIRLPYSNALLHGGAAPNGVDFHKNSDLKGLTGLEIMDKIVAYADTIGMRILLDNHRVTAGHGAEQSGLWHSAAFSEDQWVADLRFVANRYRNMPAVIGIDLFNEPHGAARWGGGGPNDWRRAAERGGNAVLAASPDWLIVVEGVAQAEGSHYWDGGNLAGARRQPVRLARADKLVYSTHVYPASVYAQPWLSGANFERNLPSIWRKHWAFLFEQQEAPVLIGEFGSHLKTRGDRVWMQALVRFLARPVAEGRVAWAYWSWNPNSGDTGGILQDDWNGVQQAKLDVIGPLFHGPASDGRPRRNIAAIALNEDSPG